MRIIGTESKFSNGLKKLCIFLTIFFVIASPIIGVCLLFVPTGNYISNIAIAIRRYGFSWDTAGEIGWNTRWLIGQFRNAPSDAEMTDYLMQHKFEFNNIIDEYYKNIGRPEDIFAVNVGLKPKLRSIKIWRIVPDGPVIPEINKGGSPFQQMGVSFRLVDHGPQHWLSSKNPILKSYLYVPTIPPETSIYSTDPMALLRATGSYTEETNTDSPIRKIVRDRCAVTKIDKNWFIQSCGTVP